jgi:predicted nuclease of predicted toxin-antitoxin system
VKLLLDENLPHKLRQHLPGHDVFTTAYMNWGGIRNGELLARAATEQFDALITIDSGIEFEQNLSALPCSIVIIRAPSSAFEHIEPFLPALLETLKALRPKILVKINPPVA